MITKRQFFKFIDKFNEFKSAIKRVEKAISGEYGYCNLYETDWFLRVEEMYDIFIESHFTNYGVDLVNWWMFEDVDHTIWQTKEADLFSGKSEIEYNLNDREDLWNFMNKYKEDYFKNAE